MAEKQRTWQHGGLTSTVGTSDGHWCPTGGWSSSEKVRRAVVREEHAVSANFVGFEAGRPRWESWRP